MFRSYPIFIILLLLHLCAIALYLCAENAVPFWDFAMYHQMAYQFWGLPTFGSKVNAFLASLEQNYNFFFTLPSLASFSFFNPSRFVFILTNYVFFTVSFLTAIGFLLRQIYGWAWNKSLIISFAVAMALPFLWVPLLEGYPDHGASAFLTCAVALLFIQQKRWQHFLALGALLAGAIIFRRHYAFPALCVIMTMGLFDFIPFIKASWQQRVQIALHYILCALTILGVLILIEPSYFKSMLTTNYITLYDGYKWPASYFIHYVFAQMGIGLFLAVCCGYGLHIKEKPELRNALYKSITLFVLWLALWAIGPSQAGHHYLVSILPLFCVIGLASFFVRSCTKQKEKIVILFIGLFLIFNTLYSFWLAPRFIYPSEPPKLSILSTPRIPWVRTDQDTLKEIGMYLYKTTSQQDKIVAVGSSFIFNQSMVLLFLPNIQTAQRFLPTSEIDSQEPPPIHALQHGTVFLIATPTQYHLNPKKQKAITSLATFFPPPQKLNTYFKKETQNYMLSDGVQINIWRRIKPWNENDLKLGIKTLLLKMT